MGRRERRGGRSRSPAGPGLSPPPGANRPVTERRAGASGTCRQRGEAVRRGAPPLPRLPPLPQGSPRALLPPGQARHGGGHAGGSQVTLLGRPSPRSRCYRGGSTAFRGERRGAGPAPAGTHSRAGAGGGRGGAVPAGADPGVGAAPLEGGPVAGQRESHGAGAETRKCTGIFRQKKNGKGLNCLKTWLL